VFTARYALSPYIKHIRFVFKGLIYNYLLTENVLARCYVTANQEPQNSTPKHVLKGACSTNIQHSVNGQRMYGRSRAVRLKIAEKFSTTTATATLL
jgi:hypothetical protein